MAATQAGRATTCVPHVSWLTGLRQPAQQILLVLSLAAIVAGALLRDHRAPSTGDWLLVGGVIGLLLVALVMGGIRATGGEVELGIVSLPLWLFTPQRRIRNGRRSATCWLGTVTLSKVPDCRLPRRRRSGSGSWKPC